MKTKRLLLTGLSCVLLLTLTACAVTSAPANPPVSAPAAAAPALQETANKKILIAYFSRADNTIVRDPSAVDIQATTSASLLPPGNVTIMAQLIQQHAGGDLFAIKVQQPYPENYEQVLNQASDEAVKNARPPLASHVENMADYDIIFLGYPNWDYGAPMAVRTFLEEYDLSGKLIIPFCAHGTGGLSSSVRQISQSVPHSTVGTPIGISRTDMDKASQLIENWLSTLSYEKK